MVDRATGITERKYITVILGILLFEGPKYFGELKKEIGCISAKTLTDRLNLLVNNKIVTRTIMHKGKIRMVRYTLTALGEQFYPVMKTLKEWGDKVFK